jgi:hypothetical protein
MPCYHPLVGYRSAVRNEKTGKRSIVFTKRDAYTDLRIRFPCGQCIGCRLERSRQWAIRCMHEASLYDKNSFITLTYNPENLPKHGTLVKEDHQKFMKRLRRHNDERIRYFHCGEYGEKFARPHYHTCLFNYDFPDRILLRESKTGEKYYISQELAELWPYGHHIIGDVTFESAAYVARYITKKITGKKAEDHYEIIDEKTGEILGQRVPEYITMSRRPGVGMEWFKKFHRDIYPGDFVIVRGKKMKPPKYYDRSFEIEYPEEFAHIKATRFVNGAQHKENNTPERLRVRKQCQEEKFKKLVRGYENE